LQAPSITPHLRVGELPLSYAQQRLWFLDQLQPGNSSYNIALALRLTGPLELEALEHSLNQIVDRHEALRTTFVAQEGRPQQVIAPTLSLSTLLVDMSALAVGEREAELRRLAQQEAQQPFDLTT